MMRRRFTERHIVPALVTTLFLLLAGRQLSASPPQGVEIRLTAVSTAVVNGFVTVTANVQFINNLNDELTAIRAEAKATDKVSVNPSVLLLDRIRPKQTVALKGTLVTVRYPVPSQSEDSVNTPLDWSVTYTGRRARMQMHLWFGPVSCRQLNPKPPSQHPNLSYCHPLLSLGLLMSVSTRRRSRQART